MSSQPLSSRSRGVKSVPPYSSNVVMERRPSPQPSPRGRGGSARDELCVWLAGDEPIALDEPFRAVAQLLGHPRPPEGQTGLRLRPASEVAHLLRIVLEVEQLLAAGLRPPDVLVALADQEVVAKVVLIEAGVLAVDCIAPFGLAASLPQEWQDAAAGDGLWYLH